MTQSNNWEVKNSHLENCNVYQTITINQDVKVLNIALENSQRYIQYLEKEVEELRQANQKLSDKLELLGFNTTRQN
ncbi:hypothetical protein WJR50_32950 [Catalinimonas sp. 4WD22]|uniref:hypothetical protein n=1 Tax=Catalinimonas locisalis TaxID=3133978 RepID=UPI00310137A7